MIDKEVVAAILCAVLTAQKQTSAEAVKEAVKLYHACLTELQNFGAVPPEERWSASAEHARLNAGSTPKAV